ncbi:NUDIX hydrolase [Xylanimonas cellulosilytica DSM 15894]|uniref:NUDIX hydrolase n=1 Tax=Xylanimonas cellulosilytica (strain DSM 15894 / JCM 12276 / CECT 5975 / KCTC 9989 / LMG 20990 / NBRC 107835 / XIL07) TaxID=446471 RepID=D1BUU9_XYLCX|nr:NUDIX hydrolase [Xylanimonas cellulosilytica]ACZ29340.1 NUDIX hydrolase [Xylanimonas cellulosilytica DSM 15894]
MTARVAAVRTAGGLVWRVRGGRLQVLLVHRPRYDDWSWPKGKLEIGESHQAAAVREIAEETGKPVVLGAPLPSLRYRMPDGRWKTVTYWAARRSRTIDDFAALAARHPVPPVSEEEIDQTRWLDVAAATAKLTRRTDRKPLVALAEEFEQGRLPTHVVVIARHGKAMARSTWPGDEATRPLTPMGHAHAAAIVPVLAAYGVTRVVSSRWERCAATVAPYVQAARLKPWYSEHLTETEHERSPARVAATVRELLETPSSVVLCTHRPVLPTVLDVLGQHSRRSVADKLPSDDPFLDPGELLVAHVARTGKGPRVVAVEKVTPPLS